MACSTTLKVSRAACLSKTGTIRELGSFADQALCPVPYIVNDPNGMDVDYINRQEVHPAPHPLDRDEELETFGEIQDFSQPIIY
eukprot:scaffold74877_cov38-Cyclotella_meneghiniana.AAC.4